MNNFYIELGLERSLSTQEIQKLLKKEKKKWLNRTNAPDLNKRQEAERKMQLIQEAEAVFSNDQSRADYDRQLEGNQNFNNSQSSTHNQNTDYSGKDIDSLLQEAWERINNGDYANAIAMAREAIRINSEYAYAWGTFAYANEKFNNPNEAIDAYKRAISLAPNAAVYYCDLAGVLYDTGNKKEAEVYVDKAIYLDANIDKSQALKAYLLSDRGEHDKALEIGQSLFMKDPDSDWINNVMANLYYSKGISYCYQGDGDLVYNIDPEATKNMIEYMKKAKTHNPNNKSIDEKIAWGEKAFEKTFDSTKVGLYGIPAVMFIFGMNNESMIVLSLIVAGIVTYLCFRPNWELYKSNVTGQDTALDFASTAGRGLLAATLKFIGLVFKIIGETIKIFF